MKRILFLFIGIFLWADDTLEVKALHLNADENKGIIELNDDVEVKRGRDELHASKVIKHIDKNRMPTNYAAYGGVDFVVVTKDNRILQGEANEVYCNALNGEYRLVGNSKVVEKGTTNAVRGEEIIINNDIGYVNITGTSKQPAKIIFKLEEDKNE